MMTTQAAAGRDPDALGTRIERRAPLTDDAGNRRATGALARPEIDRV
ncbi:MAG TPA: hypothetical protein VKB71_03090 [Rhizomicrobium sp.]|nr:hypothetical protein [Rhizomicrobium sp.]